MYLLTGRVTCCVENIDKVGMVCSVTSEVQKKRICRLLDFIKTEEKVICKSI